MAYVNVFEWTTDEVTNWLSGLDDGISSYSQYFANNAITGSNLLHLTVDDLYRLNVSKIGHQEVILQAIEQLRRLHFNLDSENLQNACLRLSCKAKSLLNQVRMSQTADGNIASSNGTATKMGQGQAPLPTWTIRGVGDVLDAAWQVLAWLYRPPFATDPSNYGSLACQLRRMVLALATNTQRDRFSERPVQFIREICENIGTLCDCVVQDVVDSTILQPAYLDLASARRGLSPELPVLSKCGILLQGQIKSERPQLVTESPLAHIVQAVRPSFGVSTRGAGLVKGVAGRVAPGDEIVQVNYQTVVGWSRDNVVKLLNGIQTQTTTRSGELTPKVDEDIVLTLKKRPKQPSSLTTGQIYIKPFRIPARYKKDAFQFPTPARLQTLDRDLVSLNKEAARMNSLNIGRSATSAVNDDDDDDSGSCYIDLDAMDGQKGHVSPASSATDIHSLAANIDRLAVQSPDDVLMSPIGHVSVPRSLLPIYMNLPSNRANEESTDGSRRTSNPMGADTTVYMSSADSSDYSTSTVYSNDSGLGLSTSMSPHQTRYRSVGEVIKEEASPSRAKQIETKPKTIQERRKNNSAAILRLDNVRPYTNMAEIERKRTAYHCSTSSSSSTSSSCSFNSSSDSECSPGGQRGRPPVPRPRACFLPKPGAEFKSYVRHDGSRLVTGTPSRVGAASANPIMMPDMPLPALPPPPRPDSHRLC